MSITVAPQVSNESTNKGYIIVKLPFLPSKYGKELARPEDCETSSPCFSRLITVPILSTHNLNTSSASTKVSIYHKWLDLPAGESDE